MSDIYTINDIKELIMLWFMDDCFECESIDNCEWCRKCDWCDCDTFILTMSYLQNGEYYG